MFPSNLPVVCVCFHLISQLCLCFHPFYQLCVFPPNLPVVCVFTQFTSWGCFHPMYQLCVFPSNLPVVCVFPSNLPVVFVLLPNLPVVCVCIFPPDIPAVRVLIFCFYQVLSAFIKLKIMSEIPHNKWQLKTCHNYSHKLIFDRGDNRLFLCFNRGTQIYRLWQLILLIHCCDSWFY